MKKLLLLLLATLSITFSCKKDECTEEAQIQYLSTKSTKDLIIINQDTCIDGDYHVEGPLRINGDYTLTVLGDLTTEGSLIFVGNGKVKATSSIQISGDAFFLGGGYVEADMALVISGHARDQNNIGGIIKYCTFESINKLDPGILLIEDCDDAVECETLSIGGVGISNGDLIELPCGFDYENQEVKTNSSGNQYIYIKI